MQELDELEECFHFWTSAMRLDGVIVIGRFPTLLGEYRVIGCTSGLWMALLNLEALSHHRAEVMAACSTPDGRGDELFCRLLLMETQALLEAKEHQTAYAATFVRFALSVLRRYMEEEGLADISLVFDFFRIRFALEHERLLGKPVSGEWMDRLCMAMFWEIGRAEQVESGAL